MAFSRFFQDYLNSQQIRKLAEDKLKVMLREEVK